MTARVGGGVAGLALGTASSGVIARVAADGAIRLPDGAVIAPHTHRGDRWVPLGGDDVSVSLADPGAVGVIRDGEVTIRCAAEQVSTGPVLVIEVTNTGDSPVGVAWVWSGDARRVAGVDGGIEVDGTTFGCVQAPGLVTWGDGEADHGVLDGADVAPAAIERRRSRATWAAVGRPVPHGYTCRWYVADRVAARDGAASSVAGALEGIDAVEAGWRAFVDRGTTIEADDPGLAALWRSAATRVAIGTDALGVDHLFVAVVGSPEVLPAEGLDVRARELRDPVLAERAVAAVARWARSVDHDPEDPSESSTAMLELAVRGLRTLERAGVGCDRWARAWVAELARRTGQPSDTVVAIADGPARGRVPPAGGDIASQALAGWDDTLVERLVRVQRRRGGIPTRFAPGTARPEGQVDDAVSAAAVVEMFLRMLARDHPDGTVEILDPLPDAWRGASVEVHGLDVASGTLSFGLRWHGANPALLWELRRTGVGEDPIARSPLVLRAPGLSTTWRGEGDHSEELVT